MDARPGRIALTDSELRLHQSGLPAWLVAARFHTGDAATVGWLVKQDGQWRITPEGRTALEDYPRPEVLYAEITRRYREISRNRKHVGEKYEDKLEPLARALEQVPEGSWTAYDDLADLIGATPEEIAHLLAETHLANSHRALWADGQVPSVAHQHSRYRGVDLQERLSREGVEFDNGRARPDRRISSDLLFERTFGDPVAEVPPSRRAWLIRGSNVDGEDLVPWWLQEGLISLAAAHLPRLTSDGLTSNSVTAADVTAETIRELVNEAYRHKTYSLREKLAGQFDAFVRGMRPDDYVLTENRGELYVGLVDGEAYSAEPPDRSSNLRRRVKWQESGRPLARGAFGGPLGALVQKQDDLIDLTDALDVVEQLYQDLAERLPSSGPAPEAELSELSTVDADELLSGSAAMSWT